MELREKILKKPWPYWIGGVTLALLNILLLFTTETAWRISTSLLYVGLGFLEKLGVDINSWYYIKNHGIKLGANETYFNNGILLIAISITAGSLISVLISSQFKFKRIKNKKQLLFALLGGIIMGYGTRLSFGCNIGAYFSAIPSMSLHGWVFGIFTFVGAWIGSKILLKYII